MAQPDYEDINYQTDFVPSDPLMGIIMLIVFYIIIPICIWAFFILWKKYRTKKSMNKPKNPYL